MVERRTYLRRTCAIYLSIKIKKLGGLNYDRELPPLYTLQEIKNLKQENELLSSTLDMVNAKIDSMSRSSKILFKDSFDYELGTPITFNPISDQGYLVICLPTYHNINTFAYIIQLIRLKPGEKSFSVNVLWRYDGVPTTSGTFDLQFIFIPVQI